MIGQISKAENGRFRIDTLELMSGDEIDVLICNGLSGKAEWITSTVYHNGEDYYLSGLLGYSIVGLFAKYPTGNAGMK